MFRAIPAALGVSAQNQLAVNSIAVPRVQGDAVGAICRLSRDEKDTKVRLARCRCCCSFACSQSCCCGAL